MEQDLCKTVIAASEVNWATTLDCSPTVDDGEAIGHVLLHVRHPEIVPANSEGRYKATWKGEFKLPWRKAGLLKSSR